MKYIAKSPALLVLEDGTVFKGRAIGKKGISTGEICFNTGMTGYQEIFTDPSYTGQILLATTPHIGNYGIHTEEVESESIKIAGLVCKTFSDKYYSRAGAESNVQEYFEEQGLVGIAEVDTRAIVRHIRDKGAMNAIISSDILDEIKLKEMVKAIPSMAGLELSSKVSCTEPFTFGDESSKHKVAVLDLGVKTNILRCLAARGCYLKVFPYNSTFEEMKAWGPEAFMLTNGPGDPSAMTGVVEEVKKISNSGMPVFGICLGHQVLCLANGLTTSKMHNGHRGINHPVQDLVTKKCEVTSQNHGFVVDREAAEAHANVEITHVHLNDNTVAGIKLKDKQVFSVQYHPEASAGPHDSAYLFDQFVENIAAAKDAGKLEITE